MVFQRSQSSHLLSSLSSAWAWAGKWDVPINPNKCACLTVGKIPPLSPSFSAAGTDHRIPQVTDDRDLGVPLDTTFTASAHCIEAFAVLGPKILLWTIKDSVYSTLQCLSGAPSRVCNGSQRSYTEGGYKPTWEGPTPCNTSSERSSSRALWGKALPSQLLFVGTQMPSIWPHPGLQNFERRSWPKPVWILPPPTPSGTFSVRFVKFVTLSIYLQKTVGPPMVRNLPCSTCVTPVPTHWQFSQCCYPRLFMFSLTPNPWPAYVVIIGPRGHSYR